MVLINNNIIVYFNKLYINSGNLKTQRYLRNPYWRKPAFRYAERLDPSVYPTKSISARLWCGARSQRRLAIFREPPSYTNTLFYEEIFNIMIRAYELELWKICVAEIDKVTITAILIGRHVLKRALQQFIELNKAEPNTKIKLEKLCRQISKIFFLSDKYF